MVEKQDNTDITTVLVDGFNIAAYHPYSVGAAIRELEEKLAKQGILVQVPNLGSERTQLKNYTSCGKLLCLSLLICLGISHAIDTSDTTSEENVAKFSHDCRNDLVPGKVIALYDANQGAFLRLIGGKVDYGGGDKSMKQLPFEWDSERFLVVKARNNSIAFYSPSHRKFLACQNGRLTAGYPIMHHDEMPRTSESFRIAPSGSNRFQLICPIGTDTPFPASNRYFNVCNVQGFD